MDRIKAAYKSGRDAVLMCEYDDGAAHIRIYRPDVDDVAAYEERLRQAAMPATIQACRARLQREQKHNEGDMQGMPEGLHSPEKRGS